jgi:DNA polymerase/3'-5' exonuclease PolX
MTDDRRKIPDKVGRPLEDIKLAAYQIERMSETLSGSDNMYVVAGSFRRQKPTIGDLDILVPPILTLAQAEHEFELLFHYEQIQGGELKAIGICQYKNAPLLINLWLVPEDINWGAMLLYATGPYDLNIMMRARAKGMGYTLNQYGLYNSLGTPIDKGYPEPNDEWDAVEASIFDLLNLPFLLPVERENWRPRLLRKPPTTTAINVPSSKGSDYYQVTIQDGEAVDCECKGFAYRHKCRHLQEAEQMYANRQKDS